MSLIEARFYSRCLQKKTGMLLLLPEDLEPPFPVMCLLHGLSDDYGT